MSRSLREAVDSASVRLAAAGIDDAVDDARRLLQHATGLDRAGLIAEDGRALTEDEADGFETLVARRLAREPISQILGTKAFWTLDLKVTPDVLTPRADTEIVVEAALATAADRSAPLRILDIGTGSGAILLALLSELPNATGIGTDSSPDALAVARENAEACGLADRTAFVETEWADGVDGPFDLVVSNPPYIATDVIAALEPEVRDHEPRAALDGGPDGLAAYPGLFEAARALLTPGGIAVFEIGWDQGARAAALAEAAGAAHIRLQRDLAGRDRALVLRFL